MTHPCGRGKPATPRARASAGGDGHVFSASSSMPVLFTSARNVTPRPMNVFNCARSLSSSSGLVGWWRRSHSWRPTDRVDCVEPG